MCVCGGGGGSGGGSGLVSSIFGLFIPFLFLLLSLPLSGRRLDIRWKFSKSHSIQNNKTTSHSGELTPK